MGAPDSGDRAQIYLHAGQLAVAARPTAVTTILGSCVSVCLYDPVAKVGGVNHFLLPLHVERERSPRFGTVAVPQLVEEVVRAGASRGALVAKVFGGASVIGAFRTSRNLGEENAVLALRLLEEARIPVLDRDVGGTKGRKLIFHVDDGTAWVRQL
nr:chemotaxis protein CheD [Anaeromyxobacter oryzae]